MKTKREQIFAFSLFFKISGWCEIKSQNVEEKTRESQKEGKIGDPLMAILEMKKTVTFSQATNKLTYHLDYQLLLCQNLQKK